MHVMDNLLNLKSNLEVNALTDANFYQGSANIEESYFIEGEDFNEEDDVGYGSDDSSVPKKTIKNKINYDKNSHQCPVV